MVRWRSCTRRRPSGDIVAKYLASGAANGGELIYTDAARSRYPGSEYIRLEAIRVRSTDGEISTTLDVRFPFTIEVQYRVLRRTTNLRIGVRLSAHEGTVLLSTTDMDEQEELTREPGVYVSRCQVPAELLNYGLYYVTVGCDTPAVQSHFLVDHGLAFHVAPTGGVGGHINDGRTGLLRLRLPWTLQRVDH